MLSVGLLLTLNGAVARKLWPRMTGCACGIGIDGDGELLQSAVAVEGDEQRHGRALGGGAVDAGDGSRAGDRALEGVRGLACCNGEGQTRRVGGAGAAAVRGNEQRGWRVGVQEGVEGDALQGDLFVRADVARLPGLGGGGRRGGGTSRARVGCGVVGCRSWGGGGEARMIAGPHAVDVGGRHGGCAFERAERQRQADGLLVRHALDLHGPLAV